MGLFDFLTGGSPEKQIKKYGKKIKDKDTPIEDRQAAAIWLADNGSPEAIVALLGRFDMDYEHGMKDASEKDEVSNLVLGLGQRSIEPLEAKLRRTLKFARPLALYEQIAGQDAAMNIVLELLDVEYERSELKPDKKRQLLIKVTEYVDPRVTASAVRFLDDFDEGCRYAAAEALFAQDETPAVREALVARLASPDEESNRVRVRIAEVATARRWPLGDHADALTENPPVGYKVANGVLIAG
ncbi:MAG: hypothetical protein H6739_32450 [Alphaproteobacteria bacterium]|nr:hypothetical protein [Alphaproteobacteria bacterium]